MIKLFRVTIEDYDYDEYDEFIVGAKNAENAILQAKSAMYISQLENISKGYEKISAKEIEIIEGIISSSFCAG